MVVDLHAQQISVGSLSNGGERNMRALLLAGLACFALSGCVVIDASDRAAPVPVVQTADEAAILGVLDAQQTAWNSGDIDTFMEGYWKSEDLRFASGGNVTRGWQATIERYKRVYSDRAAMGMLAFDELEVQLLSADSAIVHGAWVLERANDRPSGLYTLVFRKFDGRWLIVSDTTTSAQ